MSLPLTRLGQAYVGLAAFGALAGLALALPVLYGTDVAYRADRLAREALELGDLPVTEFTAPLREKLHATTREAQAALQRKDTAALLLGTALLLGSALPATAGVLLIQGRWLWVPLALSLLLAATLPLAAASVLTSADPPEALPAALAPRPTGPSAAEWFVLALIAGFGASAAWLIAAHRTPRETPHG